MHGCYLWFSFVEPFFSAFSMIIMLSSTIEIRNGEAQTTGGAKDRLVL